MKKMIIWYLVLSMLFESKLDICNPKTRERVLVLTGSVLEGEDLPAGDVTGYSDPFCIVTYDGKEVRVFIELGMPSR